MPSIRDVLQGVVVETKTRSWSGGFLYSDKMRVEHTSVDVQPVLNTLAKYYVVGIVAGVWRMALAAIHTVGHLLAALVTWDKGHCYHAAKGGCEFLRGLIEATPFAGRAFARWYDKHGEWWILKIYHPQAPDTLDEYAGYWKGFRESRPTGYVVA